MVGVEVKAPNLQEWYMDAERFDADLNHNAVRVAFTEIRKMFYQWQDRAFRSGGSIQKSGRHAPLSEKYRLWKEKHYPGRPIMVLTGALMKAMTGGGGGVATYRQTHGQWHMKLGADLTFGGGYDYPLAHQTGKAAGGKVRKTIDPTDQEKRKWLLVIQKQVILYSRKRKTFIESAYNLPLPNWDHET
jgi:hypothetical protein